MLKKDDQSQQIVYYQVGPQRRKFPFLRCGQFEILSILGWHWDLYDHRGRDTFNGESAKDK